jgi:hypothetical protein
MRLRLATVLLAVGTLLASVVQVRASEADLSSNLTGTSSSMLTGRIIISDPFVSVDLSLPEGGVACHSGPSFCENDFSVDLTIEGVGSVDYTLTTSSYGAALIGSTYSIFGSVTPGSYDVQLLVSDFLTTNSFQLAQPSNWTITAEITGGTLMTQSVNAATAAPTAVPEPTLWLLCLSGVLGLFCWKVRSSSRI